MPCIPKLAVVVVGLLGLLGVTSLSIDASAYCRTTTCKDSAIEICPLTPDGCPGGGVPISWPGRCVSYSVALGSTTLRYDTLAETTERAFETWRQTICADTNAHPAILVNDTFGPVLCMRHEYNAAQPNANAIIYREGPWPYEDALSALALTSVTFDKTTGTIYDADIEINGSGNYRITTTDDVSPSDYDLQSILTHEIGHFLGLGHSQIETSTMWWFYESGKTEYRRLTADDAAGLCAIYPSSQTSRYCDFTPRQGFSPECRMDMIRAGQCTSSLPVSSGGQASAIGVAWVGAWAALRRRRRRRSSSAAVVAAATLGAGARVLSRGRHGQAIGGGEGASG